MDETGDTQRAPPGISALTAPQTSVRRSRRDSTVGILRVDIGRPRRNSRGSIEYLAPFADVAQEEPASPQPSVDRLSVTFALDVAVGVDDRSDFSGSSTRGHPLPPLPASPPPVPAPRSQPGGGMEKVHFSRETTVTDGEEDEEEDYSASVSAIMQRRASTRRPSKRRSRRPSSPFSPDADSGQSAARRRSSVFTTSSGDTAISMDEGTTQEQIYENLRLHKEVLSSVKQQPWNMHRKLRLVQQAKAYVKRHEGELQERLAQSKTTRDILARFSILRGKFWQYLKRELNNLINALVPWELRIKEIESHFGSVVASYFIFLRWLFWVNLVLATLLCLFVVMPEMLMADRKSAGGRKEMLPEEVPKSRSLVTLWNFEGILKYSPIFYGYFTNRDGNMKGYRLPFAYFMTGLAVYIYSFVATLRRMAENSRMSKLSEKDDECVFTWKLLSGWDYMIGNAETAHNRVASIILGFKEALLEEAEKKKDARNWKVIALRVMVNMFVLVLLISSAYAVVEVVKRSKNTDGDGWWRQNEITVVLSLISFVFPLLFEALGLLESYHPRKQLRIQLARIMVLNLLNLYTLIFALFDKIEGMTIELKALKPNDTLPTASYRQTLPGSNFEPGLEPPALSLQNVSDAASSCFQFLVPCTTPSSAVSSAVNVTASLIAAFMMSKFFTTPTPFQQSANASDSSSNGSFTTSVFDYLNVTGGNFSLSYLNMTEEDLVTALNLSNETSGSFDYYSTRSEEDHREERFDYDDVSDATEMASASSIEDTVEILSRYVTEMLANMSTTTESSWVWNQSTTTDLYDSNSTYDYSIDAFNFSTTLDEILPTLTSILRNLSTQIPIEINETQSDDIRSVVDSILTTLSSRETTSDAELCYETRCNESTSEMTSTGGEASSDSPWGVATSTSLDDLLPTRTDMDNSSFHLSVEKKKRLRYLCWETMFGQELVKLTVMDLVITIFSTLLVDFFRAIFVRVMNNCWCWDLEKQFPQYGDFKIAENILHLVNNQGMVWMGMFFSPALPLLNLIKLGILMYLRSWAVLTCNVPHEIVFRASRSNNFYFALLLTMLFLCVLPVGYAIVWVEPSWHCGPFSNYSRIYHMFTKSLYKFMPEKLHLPMDYIASPGIVIPLLMLLVLIIYYLISLTGALREANNDLKIQLRRERTEERRKMFQLVDRRRRKGSGADSNDTPFARWKKILPVLPTHKATVGDAGVGDGDKMGADAGGNVKADSNRNELISRLMKRALRKSSATSDEESVLIADGDDGNSKPTKTRPKKADFKHIVDATKKKDKENKEKMCPRKDGETSKKKMEPSTTEDQNETADREGEGKARPPKNHSKHHPSNKKRASIRSKSPSTSSTKSNKERGEDSQNSGVWSDNIPVIRIIKTDSTDILDAHQHAEPQQPSKSSSSDTVVAVPVASSSGVVPKSFEQKQISERKALAKALLKEARRWREQEDRKGHEQVAMIEIPSDDGPAAGACEDHPEVYI